MINKDKKTKAKANIFAFGIILTVVLIAIFAMNMNQKGVRDPNLPFHEGYDFLTLDRPADGVAQNNITELFWYGCPHCLSVEPLARRFKIVSKAEGWEFDQIHYPATSGAWGFDFNVYAAFKQLNVDQSIGKDYMKAVQSPSNMDRNSLDVFLENNDIDPKEFRDLMENNRRDEMRASAMRFISEQVQGTPKFVVSGKYLILETKDPIALSKYLINKQP